MTMQRRHFELIAETIRCAKFANGMTEDCRKAIAAEFATALKATNANFNKDRFLTACGVV